MVFESILRKGLSRMGRNHVLFITGDIDELKKIKGSFDLFRCPKGLRWGVTVIQIRGQGYPMSRESGRGNSDQVL